jgi:glycosyltransferase involved in cell wall biosynthesis
MSVYERENPDYLSMALDSVLNQSVRPQELVIVQDGPLTSQLDAVLSQYRQCYSSQVKLIKLEKNVGLGTALSIGLQQCRNSIIARMDSDDISDPKRFEKQLKILNNCPEIDIVGSWISEFSSDPRESISVRQVPLMHDEIYGYAKYRNPMNHMTVMFRKEAVLEAGNYQDLPFFEDYFLWIRMLKNGSKFSNLSENLVSARIGNKMFGRRRGVSYLKRELKLLTIMKKTGFINNYELTRNSCIRTLVRILPAELVGIVYKRYARGKVT